MRDWLLEYLRCWRCGGDFRLTDEKRAGEEILEGQLACPSCRIAFPIRGGIARLLPDHLEKGVAKTARNFGREWKIFHQISHGHIQQLRGWLSPISDEFFQGKVIVDMGCGMARYSRYFAEKGARRVIGLDVSEAVEAAYENCRGLPNVEIIQGDIYNLPLTPAFDLSFSVGVLHHLPDPEKGFQQLVRLARPGGWVFTWVYGRENNDWVVYLVNPLRIHFTSRLPALALRFISVLLTGVLFTVLKGVYRPMARFFPKLAGRLFYADYLHSVSPFTFRELELIVYDHLTAPIAFYIRKEELESWFERAGIPAFEVLWHNRNSWKGFGEKPA